ncbi:hypothetical protein CMK22_02440 [Candidatus Poribacteria bacterium]|nr:hypothetical protein [Candidatus Poribacteria bacterium]
MFRAIIVGLVWVVFQSATASYIHGNSIGQLIANHLPLGGLFFLIVLVLIVNPILRVINDKSGFSVSELVVIWTVISAASAVPGYGMMEFLFPILVAPIHFAAPQNQWKEFLFPHLPEWLYVSDSSAVSSFYIGESTVPWQAWFQPASFWILTSLILSFIVICWSVIIRKQWVERERYPFPLVQIPNMIIEQQSGQIFNRILSNRFLWIGCVVALVIHLLRGLHRYWPVIPHLQISYGFGHLITERPWVALVQGWPLWGRIYLAVVGVTYFLQLDVSFSLWFFFFCYKLQEVCMSAFSIQGISTQHQVMGADLVLIGFLIWMSRRHLREVFEVTVGRRSDPENDGEAMSYQKAVIGIIISSVALVAILCFVGMSLLVSIAFLLLLGMMITITCWMVANAGMLLVNVGIAPFSFLTIFFGTRSLGRANLTLLGFDRSVVSTWSSESLMPYVLQSLRLSDKAPAHRRKLVPLIIVSILVAVVIAYFSSLKFIYHQGAFNLERWVYNIGYHGLSKANRAIQNPYDPNLPAILSSGFGATITGFLLYMRHRFLWWPFHPIGYIVGVTYAPCHLWFSTLLGWGIKILVLKFFGVGAYRRFRPLFLGLIIGEYFMSALWIFVGLFTKVSYWGLPH